jgi:hypothetical protein
VEDDVEQLAVGLPRLEPLLHGRRAARIQVAEVHLLVQQAEDVVVVDQFRDVLDGRPGRDFEVTLGELGPGEGIHGVDLVHVPLPDVVVEIHHETAHHARDLVRVQALLYCYERGWGWGRRGGRETGGRAAWAQGGGVQEGGHPSQWRPDPISPLHNIIYTRICQWSYLVAGIGGHAGERWKGGAVGRKLYARALLTALDSAADSLMVRDEVSLSCRRKAPGFIRK